jgi:hypothetical protein
VDNLDLRVCNSAVVLGEEEGNYKLINNMQVKYIITNHNCFALFSDTASHADVARGLHGHAVGAGFANIRAMADTPDSISVHCWGRSQSLKIESRPEDGQIITEDLNNPYK